MAKIPNFNFWPDKYLLRLISFFEYSASVHALLYIPRGWHSIVLNCKLYSTKTTAFQSSQQWSLPNHNEVVNNCDHKDGCCAEWNNLVYFMVTPCVKWCRTLFIYQLTHTTLRNVELLKHSKYDKNSNSTFLSVVCVSVGK